MGQGILEIGFDQRAHAWWFPHTRLKRVGKIGQPYGNKINEDISHGSETLRTHTQVPTIAVSYRHSTCTDDDVLHIIGWQKTYHPTQYRVSNNYEWPCLFTFEGLVQMCLRLWCKCRADSNTPHVFCHTSRLYKAPKVCSVCHKISKDGNAIPWYHTAKSEAKSSCQEWSFLSSWSNKLPSERCSKRKAIFNLHSITTSCPYPRKKYLKHKKKNKKIFANHLRLKILLKSEAITAKERKASVPSFFSHERKIDNLKRREVEDSNRWWWWWGVQNPSVESRQGNQMSGDGWQTKAAWEGRN